MNHNGINILTGNGDVPHRKCISSSGMHIVYTNDLLTGLLGLYWEIRSPIFFVRSELARAVRKSEGFVFLVQNE